MVTCGRIRPRPCASFLFKVKNCYTQTEKPRTFDSHRLLIQYIRSYPLYLQVVFYIHKLRTHHAVLQELRETSFGVVHLRFPNNYAL